MRKRFDEAEKYRSQVPRFPKTRPGDRYGLFVMPHPKFQLRAVVDDGEESGWEHVSVSCKVQLPDGQIVDHLPTWEMMNLAKRLFWEDEECVLQFHPPASQYVNRNPFVLHLWRQVGVNHPTPPTELV